MQTKYCENLKISCKFNEVLFGKDTYIKEDMKLSYFFLKKSPKRQGIWTLILFLAVLIHPPPLEPFFKLSRYQSPAVTCPLCSFFLKWDIWWIINRQRSQIKKLCILKSKKVNIETFAQETLDILVEQQSDIDNTIQTSPNDEEYSA